MSLAERSIRNILVPPAWKSLRQHILIAFENDFLKTIQLYIPNTTEPIRYGEFLSQDEQTHITQRLDHQKNYFRLNQNQTSSNEHSSRVLIQLNKKVSPLACYSEFLRSSKKLQSYNLFFQVYIHPSRFFLSSNFVWTQIAFNKDIPAKQVQEQTKFGTPTLTRTFQKRGRPSEDEQPSLIPSLDIDRIIRSGQKPKIWNKQISTFFNIMRKFWLCLGCFLHNAKRETSELNLQKKNHLLKQVMIFYKILSL